MRLNLKKIQDVDEKVAEKSTFPRVLDLDATATFCVRIADISRVKMPKLASRQDSFA